MAKPVAPPSPKEQFIKFDKREPTEAQQQLLLEAAIKMGVRPGIAGVLINHESAGTWNPEIRPSKVGEPPVKVTTDGKVVGTPGSTAVGLGQYIDPRWVLDMYVNGESIIKQAELQKYDPAAVNTIRAANKLVQAELDRTKQKPSFDTFVGIETRLSKSPEILAVQKLRSDQNDRIPIYAVMHSIRDYSKELSDAGLDVNTTNIYAVHHNSLGKLKQLLANKDYVAADDPKMAGAVAANGAVYTKADGTPKTSAETYAFYASVASDQHATNFERKYYGRDFGPSAEASTPHFLKGNDGQAYAVRRDLIMPRLPEMQFLEAWKHPGFPADKPENLAATVSGLERLGFDFGKQRPTDFKNPRLVAAISVFKHHTGLPHADAGEFDTSTQAFLKQAVTNADKYIALQQQQKAALKAPEAVPLRKLEPQKIVELKEALLKEGLLQQPTERVRMMGRDGKRRLEQMPVPFDGKADSRLQAAYKTYQLNHGLLDGKGIYDTVTDKQLLAPKAAAPAAAPAKVSYLDPTPQFAALAGTALPSVSAPGISLAGLSSQLDALESPAAAPSRRPVVTQGFKPQG